MGRVYQGLGLPAKAEPLLRGALEKRRSLFGENSYETAEAMSALGWFLDEHGSSAEALDLSAQALAVAARVLAADDARLAWIRYYDGIALLFVNHLDEAREQLERALPVFRTKEGSNSQGVIWCLNDLGNVFSNKGDLERALVYQEEALAIRRTLPPNHPELAGGLNNVANTLRQLGRLDQARRLAAEAVAISEITFGRTHGSTGVFLDTLAGIEFGLGDLAAADRDSERAVDVCEASFGHSHTYVSEALLTRAQVQRDLGQLSDSEATFQKLLLILEDTARQGGPERLIAALREYVDLLKKQGRTDAVAEAQARIRTLEQKKGGA